MGHGCFQGIRALDFIQKELLIPSEGHWEDPNQVEFLGHVEMANSSVVHDTEGTWGPDKKQMKKC